jgi:Flp pilus assembly protein TadG
MTEAEMPTSAVPTIQPTASERKGTLGRRAGERGQTLVIFAIAFIGIVAAMGLVIDGGAAFAFRRDAQNAADLAAMAGANDWLTNHDTILAVSAARSVAASNGFSHGSGGITVDVTITPGNGTTVQVDITAPHRNYFAAIIGQPTWTVGTTATALTGIPNSAKGGSPFIASIDAFNSDGSPKYTTPTNFGETNGDIPTSSTDIAWTNYGTGNVNTNEVDDIIHGSLVIERTYDFGTYIGQQNNGNHTTLFTSVDMYLAGQDVPTPIVDHAGNFMGWGMFHIISATAAGSKYITGYFQPNYFNASLTIEDCDPSPCQGTSGGYGSYVLKLVN